MKITQWQTRLNALFVFILGLVLLGAFGYQIIKKEPPCPLCLLQRLGMLGIMVGCMLNLKFGVNMAHYGLMLLSACFGGTVSLRQIGLHVCPQFQTFGEPVFGFDLYAWALFVFASSILATSLLLYLYGINKGLAQVVDLSPTRDNAKQEFKANEEAKNMTASSSMLKAGYDTVLNTPGMDMVIGNWLVSKGKGGESTDLKYDSIDDSYNKTKNIPEYLKNNIFNNIINSI
jgi:disulfide bond formation protein DsbB